MNGLNKFFNGIGNTIDKAPEIYDDGLKPATKETGKTIALIPKTINAALSPLRQWIAQKEYNVAETEKLLAIKLEHVGEEKIVSPEAYVAVPAIQAISYSMNSLELRELYANLLAKSMCIDTKNNVHPSFVEIIKQLSPLDAKVFKIIMQREGNPIVDLIIENDKKHFFVIATNVSDIEIASQELISISIDNLEKQKLIFIPSDGYYSDEAVYNKITNSEYYLKEKNKYSDNKNGFKFSMKKKQIRKTNLGKTFYDICVKEF